MLQYHYTKMIRELWHKKITQISQFGEVLTRKMAYFALETPKDQSTISETSVKAQNEEKCLKRIAA